MRFARSTFLHVFVTAALLLRALIPAGFMPAVSGGTPALVLCTAQGAKVIDGGGARHHQQAQCPFAAALGMAALPSTALILPVSVVQRAPHSGNSDPAFRQAPSSFNARGPPVLA